MPGADERAIEYHAPHMRMRLGIGALAIAVLAACGGTSDGVDESRANLVIDPPTSEHMILNGAPVSQAFTATLVDDSGNKRDVTSETVFSIDPGFGAFAGNTLAIAAAGKTLAFGTWHDKMGSAQVIARLKSTRVEPPLPGNTPDIFNSPEDPTKAPRVVYPADGIVVPRNLGDFEVHWTDPLNDVFEVSLKTEFADVRVYVAGNNGVPAAGPRPSWSAFAALEWSQSVGLEAQVSYQVRGASTQNPTYVGSTEPRLVRLTNEQMEGGLYYWAAASSTGAEGIYRHDMAKPGQPAEEFMTVNQTSGKCVACHVLSRDGKQMAITYDGGDRPATTLDVGAATLRPSVANWNFATYTADATRLLTVFQGVLKVRDAITMAELATMPAAGEVSHPDLSVDGTRLVYVRKTGSSDWNFPSGTIYTRTYDPITHAFGPETPLVTDGVNNYYPSWSPDGKWVLFNRGDNTIDDTNGVYGAYNNHNASLWVVRADGGAPIELAAANQALGGLTNSWGRWAPFQQTVGVTQEPVFWITVSSKRDFGVRRVNSVEPTQRAKTPQIWMTPFYLSRAAAAQDPSATAFRLPFQSLTSNNHIAQWTERVVVTL